MCKCACVAVCVCVLARGYVGRDISATPPVFRVCMSMTVHIKTGPELSPLRPSRHAPPAPEIGAPTAAQQAAAPDDCSFATRHVLQRAEWNAVVLMPPPGSSHRDRGHASTGDEENVRLQHRRTRREWAAAERPAPPPRLGASTAAIWAARRGRLGMGSSKRSCSRLTASLGLGVHVMLVAALIVDPAVCARELVAYVPIESVELQHVAGLPVDVQGRLGIVAVGHHAQPHA